MNRALKTALWTIIGLTAYIIVVTVVILYGWGFRGRTLFEWLDILIFPAVLAVGICLLNLRQGQRDREADKWQRQRQHQAEERRRQREQELEDQRRSNELAIEEQRAQDAALQGYVDQMGIYFSTGVCFNHSLSTRYAP